MKPTTTGQPGLEPLGAANRMSSAAVGTVHTIDEVHQHQSQAPSAGGSLPPDAPWDRAYEDSSDLDYPRFVYTLREPSFVGRRDASGLDQNPRRIVRGGMTLAAGLLGLAGIWGAMQLLVSEQAPEERIEIVAPSRQLLTAVLQQNYLHKVEEAAAALAAGELLTETERPGVIRHRIEEGDTLWLLTQRYQIDAAAIAIPNQITAATPLEPGSELLIPGEMGLIVRVQPGDTLAGLASRYRVSQGDIIRATQLTNPNWLQIGQPLLIPGTLTALIRAERGLPPEPDTTTSAAPIAAPDLQSSDVHRIQSGDTIESLARRYGVTQQAILDLNQPLNPGLLQIGQEVRIPSVAVAEVEPAEPAELEAPEDADTAESAPEPSETETAVEPVEAAEEPEAVEPDPLPPLGIHRIQLNDTIEVLAGRYQVSEQAIFEANPGLNPRLLQLGQELRIPGAPVPDVAPAESQELAVALSTEIPDEATAPEPEAVEEAPPEPEIIPPTQTVVHRIQSGDTIEVLARQYGIPESQILQANPNLNPRLLQLGQEVRIPGTEAEVTAPEPVVEPVEQEAGPRLHTVRSGETIERIAALYGVSQSAIVQANRLSNPGWLILGQELTIPGATTVVADPTPAPEPTVTASPEAAVDPVVEPASEPVEPVVEAVVEPVLEPEVGAEVPADPTEVEPVIEAVVEPVLEPEVEAEVPADPTEVEPVIEAVVEPVLEPEVEAEVPAEPIEVEPEPVAEAVVEPVAEAELEQDVEPTVETDPVPAPEPTFLLDLAPAPEVTSAPEVAAEPEVVSEQAAPVQEPETEVAAASEPDPDNRPTPAVLPDPEPPVTGEALPSDPTPVLDTLYTVQPGDSLQILATRYGLSQQAIAQANLITNPNVLQVGQQLRIPGAQEPQADPVPAAPSAASTSSGFVWPVEGRVTSGFGWRRGRLHAGVDIPGPVGSPILAVMEGEVIYASFGRDGYGNRVDIRHPNGMVTRYAHGHQIYVSAGQWVQQGQVVMSRGNTGWSTGPHLHFEVRPGGGGPVDPMIYLR